MDKNYKIPHWARDHIRGTIDEWDTAGWQRALREEDPDGAYRAFTRLVDAGCKRTELAKRLIFLQHTLGAQPIASREAKKALKVIRSARKTVDMLERSSLRFALHLTEVGARRSSLPWLSLDLRSLENLLETAIPHASKQRSIAVDAGLVELGRYVRKATQAPRVELLAALLPTVTGDPRFDYVARRKRMRR